MIDPKLLTLNPELIRAGIIKKHGDESVLDRTISVDAERTRLRQSLEKSQAELNVGTMKVPTLQGEEQSVVRGELRLLSEQVKKQRTEFAETDKQYLALMRQIPNIPSSDVPEGASDKENVVIRTEGEKPMFSFQPKDHEILCADLDLLDTKRGVKVGGTKAYYLKNELVLLEAAVLRFALDTLYGNGFELLSVPQMAKAEAFFGAGHFTTEQDELDGDAYALDRDGLFLAGTAEIGLINYHRDETLLEGQLPLRYAAQSPCYRREAGTYGKEARGLYRVHQFQKVEMISITRPEDSELEQERLLSQAEQLLQALGLHYQVVLNCGGDLGTPQAKKWDIETWMPGLDKYGETHSCSNDTDWQARSLNMRYRVAGDEKRIRYVHTLNNTGLASPRILIALLENFQKEDGSVTVPKILHKYLPFIELRQKNRL